MNQVARRSPARRQGVALLLVTAVLAVVAVMSYAILTSAALQTQAWGDAGGAAGADYLADSGLNLAMYYLQNPAKAPTLNEAGFWPGQSGITLGSGIPGSIAITVAPVVVTGPNNAYQFNDFDTFDVTSTASVMSGAAAVSHTAKARIQVNRGDYAVTAAASFNGDLTVTKYVDVHGDLEATGAVTLKKNAVVTGQVIGRASSVTAPVPARVNHYLTYTYDGKRYRAVKLAGGPTAVDLGDVALTATTDNPAGIYWSDTAVHLNGSVSIAGTLVATGQVVVAGQGNVIQPKPGFPALICDQDISIAGNYRSLVLNGVCWAGLGITASGSNKKNSTLTVDGAFMVGGNSGIDTAFDGSIDLRFDSTKSRVRNLDAAQTADSVKLLSWIP